MLETQKQRDVALPSPRRRRPVSTLPARIGGYALVLLVWTAASGRVLPVTILPPPSSIAGAIVDIVAAGTFFNHAAPTLSRIVIGFSIAFVAGAGLGVSMRSPLVDSMFRDWVTALMSTPGLVFVLVSALVFGFHPAAPIIATAVTAFPFVTANVAEGVKALPAELFEMSGVFRVPRSYLLRHVIVPFLVPYTVTGARFAFSVAWKTATLAELFGSSQGIGFMMRLEYQTFNVAGLLAWVAAFFLVALAIEKVLLAAIERRALAWRGDAAVVRRSRRGRP